jgi:hypothetical protein
MRTSFNLVGAPYSYDGAPIHARSLAVAADYESTWRPPGDGVWKEHRRVPGTWRHPEFSGYVVSKPKEDVVRIAHLEASSPDPSRVLELGHVALPYAEPIAIGAYPLSLRLPMRGRGHLDIPDSDFRCVRLWPSSGEKALELTVDRVPIELRVSGSRRNGVLHLYAELFVGRPHVTVTEETVQTNGNTEKKQKPRSLIYPADSRHVVLEQNPLKLRKLTTSLMDKLLDFASDREDLGLDVGHRRLPGHRIGRVKVDREMEDVEFDVNLPQPGGPLPFVGSMWRPSSPSS